MKALINTKSNYKNLNGKSLEVLRKSDRYVYCRHNGIEICFTREEAKLEKE